MEENKLKPVRCGCGGEPKVIHAVTQSFVWCSGCGIETRMYDNEETAVEMWNKAVGPRTAKVVERAIDVNRLSWGKCGECGNLVFSNYCSKCGAKLDWSENDHRRSHHDQR